MDMLKMKKLTVILLKGFNLKLYDRMSVN